MTKENGKQVESVIDGFLAVKPSGTIASLLPWPKKWVSCDLIDGLLHVYNTNEEDSECIAILQLPGSEYAVDAKEPLQFSLQVRHPQADQYHFRAENNEDYTMWIDTVRACGASSRTARRTLSTASYSSRSSLVSKCSSSDLDHHQGVMNGDEFEGLTRRLQSLEESVYCSQDRLSECSNNDTTRQSLASLQNEVETLKESLETCVSHISQERRDIRQKERLFEGERIELLESVSTLKLQNDKLAIELTSEQNLNYKHSLELAQQMCINAKQWENRYLRLSLQYLKLQTFLQHIDSGFMQQSAISEYLEENHMDDIRSMAEFTDCTDPPINFSDKNSSFVDPLGFRTQFDSPGMMLRYMCQERLRDNIIVKLEPTDTCLVRWTKLLDKTGDVIKLSRESKELCRHGIPTKLRPRLWKAFISHRCSKIIKNKGPKYYQSLVQSPEISPSDKQISLDLHRSFPRNVYFNSDNGTKVPVLQRVLVAFSLHNKAIGYCQGMNMIAGMLIFHLDEETAFWGLVAILEMIMPTGYYNTDLLAARADQIIFQELVESKMPCLAAYLKHQDIDLSLFSFNWFMTIFIDSLPMSTVIRLWDIFLLEGHKTLLRFSLSLVKLHEFSLMQYHDSVSIFNMFRSTARSFYDSELIIKLAYNHFKPFPKRGELFKRHSEKLAELRTQHAENERQWRERQRLPDTVDRDTWDIVPAEQGNFVPDAPSAPCILHTAVCNHVMWAVQSRDTRGGVVLLKIDLRVSSVVGMGDCIDSKVTCCSFVPSNDGVATSGFLLLGTANGYVLSFNSESLSKLTTTWVMDCVLGIVLFKKQILVHLANGSLVRFEGMSENGLYSPSILDIGTSPVRTAVVVLGVYREKHAMGSNDSSLVQDSEAGTARSSVVDELWCSCGNTVHFVDLAAWNVRDTLCISSHSTTQIHGIVSYSTNIIFISVHTTISIWDIKKKTCLSSHDCSSIFLPPPSPKSKSYQGVRMSIHSLFYDPESDTFWVGTSHGHVLIYEVGKMPYDNPTKAPSLPDYEEEIRTGAGASESDDDAAIAVLNTESSSPKFPLTNSFALRVSRELFGSNKSTTTKAVESAAVSTDDGGILLLGESQTDIRTNSSHSSDIPLFEMRNGDHNSLKASPSMETSLVVIPGVLPDEGTEVKLSNGQQDAGDGNVFLMNESPSQFDIDVFDCEASTASRSNGTGRDQKCSFAEYDVMEDHCDMIESAADNSPVHVYQAFNRYHSQENLDSSDKEAEFEVISDHKQNNILSLSTYQILSGDPIANIAAVNFTESEAPGTLPDSSRIMTCGGGIDQEGVIVLWTRVHDNGKYRWQAEPVSITSSSSSNILTSSVIEEESLVT